MNIGDVKVHEHNSQYGSRMELQKNDRPKVLGGLGVGVDGNLVFGSGNLVVDGTVVFGNCHLKVGQTVEIIYSGLGKMLVDDEDFDDEEAEIFASSLDRLAMTALFWSHPIQPSPFTPLKGSTMSKERTSGPVNEPANEKATENSKEGKSKRSRASVPGPREYKTQDGRVLKFYGMGKVSVAPSPSLLREFNLDEHKQSRIIAALGTDTTCIAQRKPRKTKADWSYFVKMSSSTSWVRFHNCFQALTALKKYYGLCECSDQ